MKTRLRSLCKWPPDPEGPSEIGTREYAEKARLFQVLAVNGKTVSFVAASFGIRYQYLIDATTTETATNVAAVLLDNLGQTVMELGALDIEA